jgi:hypothetical protein
VSPAEQWLRQHLPATPRPLLACMIEALPALSESVPHALAEAALRLYAEVVVSDSGRHTALPLLAADALLTHAFQAQAEQDATGIRDLASRWGAAGQLGALTERTAA